ncbi:MAG: transporter substrate-binding domain-containing protein [Geminicoccaceae bacterium]
MPIPFSSVSPAGELQGFDIDIAKALCEQMQVQCTLVQQDFDGIIRRMPRSTMRSSPRCRSPRSASRRSTSPRSIETPARFVAQKGAIVEISKTSLAGKKVGVQRATIHDSFLTDNFGDTVTIVRYGTQDETNLDLIAGRIDLILADSVALDESLLKSRTGQVRVRGVRLIRNGSARCGHRHPQERSDLKGFNAAIDAIANGTWDKIEKKLQLRRLRELSSAESAGGPAPSAPTRPGNDHCSICKDGWTLVDGAWPATRIGDGGGLLAVALGMLGFTAKLRARPPCAGSRTSTRR